MTKPEKLCVSGDRSDAGADYSFVDESPGYRGGRPGNELRIEKGLLDRPECSGISRDGGESWISTTDEESLGTKLSPRTDENRLGISRGRDPGNSMKRNSEANGQKTRYGELPVRYARLPWIGRSP